MVDFIFTLFVCSSVTVLDKKYDPLSLTSIPFSFHVYLSIFICVLKTEVLSKNYHWNELYSIS